MLSFKNVHEAIRQSGNGSVNMQRKLTLYWGCMVLAVFSGAILLLSILGIIPGSGKSLGESLAIQQQNTEAAISKQMDTLTSRSISLSGEISRKLDQLLIAEDKSFEDLDDNPELISKVEESLYNTLEMVLRSNDCSGVYFLMDATVNTKTDHADSSRMGVYLRFSDLKAVGTANQHTVYFRGAADVARQKQVQMHNRWNLEFNTDLIPCYQDVMQFQGSRLAEGTVWTYRLQLKDTWEDVMLLCVPIVDTKGKVRGICGVELSELYFSLSYPAAACPFGNMITVLAPVDGNMILLSEGMTGNTAGTYLIPEGTMKTTQERYYQTADTGLYRYLFVDHALDFVSSGGLPFHVITLIAEASYWQASANSRTMWILGSLGFLLLTLLLTFFLSHRFVKPIVDSLKAIQEQDSGEIGGSGITEIDSLSAFIRSRKDQQLREGDLPPNIEELLSDFSDRVKTLTPTERIVLKMFVDGCEISEVAERLFISIETARKHNTNLNRKLGVSNKKELMVYIDLFRRCDRLDRLIG